MGISTRSQFYFGHEVTNDNKWIDFQEGANVFAAEMRLGYYSFQEYMVEFARAMTEAGALNYGMTAPRSTRIVTLSAGGTFSLLLNGLHSENSAFPMAGFTGANKTGNSTYTAQEASGKVYRPQWFLIPYVDPEENQGAVDATVNESGSGRLEIVRFGTVKRMECNISFITNHQVGGTQIDNSYTGYEDAIEFLKDLIKKGHIEFMKDREDPDTFMTLLLEATPESQQGLFYKLKEMTADGLSEFYQTGNLVFRKIET